MMLSSTAELTREEVAAIGHNNPPADPFEAFSAHIGDLFEEAKNHLDGSAIETEAQAEAVSKLLDLTRTASKDADKARAEEKRPHDDAGKAVQAKWKPLLERADLAADTCKKVLSPWLQRKEAEARAAAEAARAEAQRRADEAAAAVRAAAEGDLAAREAAEAQVKEAKTAERTATKAEAARPQASGGARATTLRSYWTAELTDASAALKHYVSTDPDAVKAFLLTLGETDVRNGKRQLPGFTITEEKRVV